MNARDLSPKTHHTIKSVVADDLPVGLSHRPGDGNVVSFLHCMNDPQPEGRMASHIERRKFLATLGGAAAAWPLVARAQQATVQVSGFMGIDNPDMYAERLSAFR